MNNRKTTKLDWVKILTDEARSSDVVQVHQIATRTRYLLLRRGAQSGGCRSEDS